MGTAKVAPSRPKPPGNQTDPSFATTLAHGLDVLAAFRNRAGALSNAELAVHTGLSRPTVSRLTYTLAQLGYLKRNAKGRFEPGLGILATAYPVLSALKVRQMARPLMRDFAAYAGGTVSIAMPFGLDFIYVETLRTTDAVPRWNRFIHTVINVSATAPASTSVRPWGICIVLQACATAYSA